MSAVITGDQNGTVGLINAGTAVATTSGTYKDFLSIPAGVQRITVAMYGVSTNGSSSYMVQLGSGSVTTTGYSSQWWNSTSSGEVTTGLIFCPNNGTYNYYGIMTIVNLGSNKWVMTGIANITSTGNVGAQSTGGITLSGTLDRLRFTTIGGTDTFDAGSINILYE